MAKRKIVKQKKINEYAPLILVIVIAVAAMGIIPVLLDEQYDDLYADIKTSWTKQIDDFGKEVKSFADKITKLAETVDGLEGVYVENKEWEDSSEIFIPKIEEIEKFHKDYLATFENNGLNYKDYFNYDLNGKVAHEHLDSLAEEAIFMLHRAYSVEGMEQVIEDYKKEVKAIKTNIEIFEEEYSKLDKKLTLSEIDKYMYVVQLFPSIDINIFILNEYTIEDHDALKTRINTEMLETLRTLAFNDFLASVDKLPAVSQIYNDTAIKTANNALAFLTNAKYNLFTKAELEDPTNTAYLTANAKLIACKSRYDDVLLIKEAADVINTEIKKHKGQKIDASSKGWIEDLMVQVEQWEQVYGVITNVKHSDYCKEICGFMDYAGLQVYIDQYYQNVYGTK